MHPELCQAEVLLGEVPNQPLLAADVQLVGEMPDTGFAERQWLIQRDGRFIQLTELLYRIAELATGERTLQQIADSLTNSTDWIVEAADVQELIRSKLMPLGVVGRAASGALVNGKVLSPQRARSPLQITGRTKVLSPRLIDPITRLLEFFYLPAVLIPILVAALAAHAWMYGVHGVAAGAREAVYTSGGLLAVLAIVFLGGAFHEFGHASALRYGGGKVRGMGVGLYLIYPAFYTDVTDSYRLSRRARLRTDLGGVYFHLIFAAGLIAISALTHSELLLFAVLLINADMLRQLIPFARLDGYWVLADLTGIPDFFSQMGAFLRSVQPVQAFGEGRLPNLKPWVKAVFALYTLVTMPLLAVSFLLLLIHLPGFLSQTWNSFWVQIRLFSEAKGQLDFLRMALAAVQMLLLTLPAAGSLYVVYSVLRKPIQSLWRWSGLKPGRRMAGALGIVGSLILVAAIGWAPSLGLGAHKRTAQVLAGELEQVRKATALIQTLQADLEGSIDSVHFTGTVLLERPNLARIDIHGDQELKDILVISTGTDLWTYFPSENKFVRSIPGAQGHHIQPVLVDEVRFFFRPDTIGLAGQGEASAYAGKQTVDGASYDVIEVTSAGPPKRTTRYFISPTDKLIYRVLTRIERKQGATSVRWANLRNVRTNVSVDESEFRWTPPDSASFLQLPGLALPQASVKQ